MIHYEIHPNNPQIRTLRVVSDMLKKERGVCIYPTDTVYGMGACATNPKAIDKIASIMNRDKKRLFSFICSNFSQVSQYAKVSNYHFKLMKHYLPGPYTFILPATNFVPKKVCPKRKTVGIRIPDCKTCTMLVEMLGVPLANTSINLPGEDRGDPSNFFNSIISNDVNMILDIGVIENPQGSTIVDLTCDVPTLIRQGMGEWNE